MRHKRSYQTPKNKKLASEQKRVTKFKSMGVGMGKFS